MTVSDCAIGGLNMTIEDARAKMGLSKSTGHPISQLRAISALCNASEFDAATVEAPLAERKIFGDATDQAILRFAEFVETSSVAYLRSCWAKTYDLAFNSKNKFMIRCFTSTRHEGISQTLNKDTMFDMNDTSVTTRHVPFRYPLTRFLDS